MTTGSVPGGAPGIISLSWQSKRGYFIFPRKQRTLSSRGAETWPRWKWPSWDCFEAGRTWGQRGSWWAGRRPVDSDAPVARALGLGFMGSCWRLLRSVRGRLTWHPGGPWSPGCRMDLLPTHTLRSILSALAWMLVSPPSPYAETLMPSVTALGGGGSGRCLGHEGFPGGSDGREFAGRAGDSGSIHESGRPPREGNGNPL